VSVFRVTRRVRIIIIIIIIVVGGDDDNSVTDPANEKAVARRTTLYGNRSRRMAAATVVLVHARFLFDAILIRFFLNRIFKGTSRFLSSRVVSTDVRLVPAALGHSTFS